MRLAQMGEFQMTESCIQLFGEDRWCRGIVAACFWGLLGDDGCVRVCGGVGTGLLLCVFPLFACHGWFCLVFRLLWVRW